MDQFTHLSLFTGCGGFDLGIEGGFCVIKESLSKDDLKYIDHEKSNDDWLFLQKTGFKTVFANDIKVSAKKVYEYNFGVSPFYHVESIVDLVLKHKNGQKIFPWGVDLLTGGFPCQDFSVSGKRQGFHSQVNHLGVRNNAEDTNRGRLYSWMKDVIDIVEPKIFIAENVKGLSSMALEKQVIEKSFRMAGKKGYIVFPPRVLHVANFGISQNRERIFFVGLSKYHLRKEYVTLFEQNPDEFFSKISVYPSASHKYTLKENAEHVGFVKLFDALKNLKEPDDVGNLDLDQKAFSRAKFYGTHCQGNKEICLNSIGPTIRAEHHGNIEFRRLSKEHGGVHDHELNKGFSERRLTVRECARIQSFPDSFKLTPSGISTSEAYRLIGNAMPPLLAYRFATTIKDVLTQMFMT